MNEPESGVADGGRGPLEAGSVVFPSDAMPTAYRRTANPGDVAVGEELTVFVHGTFANPEYGAEDYDAEDGQPKNGADLWWRESPGGADETTADRLRVALNDLDHDAARALWWPGCDPRDGDLTYRDIGEWSGRNTHKARIKAARELADSLEELARRRRCSSEEPLHVNFVAHSHGGNVVLESLKHLSATVKPRQICLMGTPLTWRFRDPRLLYLPTLFFILAAFLFGFAEGFLEEDPTDPEDLTRSEAIVGLVIVSMIMLPLILWVTVGAIVFVRKLFGSTGGQPAYGPEPKALEKQLDGRPAVLFISPEDEADLMLQLGAAPLDAYKALVRGRPIVEGASSVSGRLVRRFLRFVEVGYVRPFSYVVAIPLVEILLERFGLGFPTRSVLINNYEMVTWTDSATYSERQVLTDRVGADVLAPRVMELNISPTKIPGTSQPLAPRSTNADEARIETLRDTITDMVDGLTEQVNLRHSGYYESQEIINRVAQTLAH